jgi:hypothetical protein
MGCTQIFMAAVAFVFAPLAPLVALAGAIVFWLSSWVYKYQLMYVFVTKIESGGVSSCRFSFFLFGADLTSLDIAAVEYGY